MTALDKYIRLEAVGQWCEEAGGAPKEVIVSFENQTLVLSDFDENPLTHWALAATRRVSLATNIAIYSPDSDGVVAIYSPDTEGFETLTIDDANMIEAIAQVSRLSVNSTPRKSRKILTIIGAIVALAAFLYLAPSLIRNQAIRMTEHDSARYLGLEMLAGTSLQKCSEPQANDVRDTLMGRTFENDEFRLVIVKSGEGGVVFPGGLLVVADNTIRNALSADDFSNWLKILTKTDVRPLADVFQTSALSSVFQYVSSGKIPQEDLDIAAEKLLDSAEFQYVADSGAMVSDPILRDQEWVTLQGICLE